MIVSALEFNANDWGGPHKALAARNRTVRRFREDGYAVFTRTAKAINQDYTGYQLVVLDDSDIKPVLPERHSPGE